MASLKKAIGMKCKDCIYDHTQAGSWRQQVENCEIPSCALWEVRPRTIATVNANRKPKGNEIPTIEI